MKQPVQNEYDVAIIGGGPAGLSAALILGRSCKRVAVFDSGTPRNASAKAVHGFLTRDGIAPREMRRIAREEAAVYGTVDFFDARVSALHANDGPRKFQIDFETRSIVVKNVLLATGMVDHLPDIPGLPALWDAGESVFLCPYCHGWENRDQSWALLAENPADAEWALLLTGWTGNLMVFTNGKYELPAAVRNRLTDAGVKIENGAIQQLLSTTDRPDQLAEIELVDGRRIPRTVLFVRSNQTQPELVRQLGVALSPTGQVIVDPRMQTSIPGIYAAGDLTTQGQQAIAAAAAGAMAGALINQGLNTE